MNTMNDIVKLAVDNYHGTVKNFSADESNEVLRKALVDLNGGSDKITYKTLRSGASNGLFEIIEEILTRTVNEGLTGNEFFNQMVEFRNIALGDTNVFWVEDANLFRVDEIAEGHQGVRRQRIEGGTEVPINTRLYACKIYEELNRILAGRVDFNSMINRVSESFQQKLLNDIYKVWISLTADQLGGQVYFPAAGSYDEDTLLDIITHVEAASGGQQVTIMGTKRALRNLAPSIQGAESKSDLYNLGYYGKFYSSDVVALPQRHAVGTTNFILPDNELTIVASTTDKPIKCVTEGDSLIIQGNPLDHGDLTQTYFCAQRYGLGVVTSGFTGIGKYQFT